MRLASCIRYAPADTGDYCICAIQGQDVESFKSGAQGSIHGCGQQPEDGCREAERDARMAGGNAEEQEPAANLQKS